MKSSPRLLLALVLICFWFSGLAGLVYQIVWARYLALFLGHTSYAVVAVLVAFMGGLALGNAWLGGRADRSRRPLRLYAWLELGIGVYALAFPAYYELCHGAFIGIARRLSPGGGGVLALKFAFSFLTILLPTVMMGATFPVLTRFVTRSLAELRQRVAALYAINSAGAVAGCLIADFWWIPQLGLQATVFAGAGINLLVGVVAWGLSAWIKEGSESTPIPMLHTPHEGGTVGLVETKSPLPIPFPASPGRGIQGENSPKQDFAHCTPEPGKRRARSDAPYLGVHEEGHSTHEISSPEPPAVGEALLTRGELQLAIAGIGLSGFVAMLYEVAWTRMLALALGSSTHAFSLMVATMITGLTVGSWLVYRWKNLRRHLEAFAVAELALAATLLGSLFFYERLPFWFARMAMLLVRQDEAYPFYEVLQALLCFAVMFAPTVCLGMTLPLVGRLATQELSRTGRSIGTVFAVNTLGTVLGAAVTGLWLMPALGLARTFALGAVINAGIGVMILGRHLPGMRWKLALAAPLCLIGLPWFVGGQLDRPWQHAFSIGLWRHRTVPETFREFRELAGEVTMKYYRDGAGSTVCVVGNAPVAGTNAPTSATNDFLALKVNGKTDASTSGDIITQLFSGHVPLLLRPGAREVLVIGLGCGMTGGAVLRHPAVQRLDLVEISPEVVQGARLFAVHNDRVLDNPRTRLVVEDAKTFLKLAASDYDVIISEPSNPWMAGVSGVFSPEYFQSCRARLRPGGLMVQWLQLYETNDRVFDLVLKTFTSVFPQLSVWRGARGDLLLVGSAEPLAVDLDAFLREFDRPEVKADLKRLDLTRLPVFLAHELISSRNGPFIAPEHGPVHSDFHPRLEFLAQRAFFVSDQTETWLLLDESMSPRPTTLLADYLKKHPLQEADLADFARYQTAQQTLRADLFQSLLLRWQRDAPATMRSHKLAMQTWEEGSLAELAARRLAPLRDSMNRQAAQDPELLHFYARFLMQAYREQRSAFFIPNSAEVQTVLRRLLEAHPQHRRVYRLHLAELAWDRGEDEECLRLGREALDPDEGRAGPLQFERDPQAPHLVLTRMLESLLRAAQPAAASELLQQATQSGLVSGDPEDRHPALNLACRKLTAALGTKQVTKPAATRAPGLTTRAWTNSVR